MQFVAIREMNIGWKERHFASNFSKTLVWLKRHLKVPTTRSQTEWWLKKISSTLIFHYTLGCINESLAERWSSKLDVNRLKHSTSAFFRMFLPLMARQQSCYSAAKFSTASVFWQIGCPDRLFFPLCLQVELVFPICWQAFPSLICVKAGRKEVFLCFVVLIGFNRNWWRGSIICQKCVTNAPLYWR